MDNQDTHKAIVMAEKKGNKSDSEVNKRVNAQELSSHNTYTVVPWKMTPADLVTFREQFEKYRLLPD